MSKAPSEKTQIQQLKRQLKVSEAERWRDQRAFEEQLAAGRALNRNLQIEVEALRHSITVIELALRAKGFEVPK